MKCKGKYERSREKNIKASTSKRLGDAICDRYRVMHHSALACRLIAFLFIFLPSPPLIVVVNRLCPPGPPRFIYLRLRRHRAKRAQPNAEWWIMPIFLADWVICDFIQLMFPSCLLFAFRLLLCSWHNAFWHICLHFAGRTPCSYILQPDDRFLMGRIPV